MAKDIFVTGTGGIATALETLEKLTKVLLEAIEDTKDNLGYVRSLIVLWSYAKKEDQNLLLYAPAEFSFKDVRKKLTKEKVPFLVGMHKETHKPYIIVRDCDKERIRQIQTNLYIEKRRISEITNSEFYNYFKDEGGRIVSFSNLSHFQVKCLGDIAQSKDFIFTRKCNDDGKYDVYMYIDDSEEDIEIINSAMLQVACDSTGSIAVMEEIRSDIDRDTIRNALDRGIFSRDHFYVVNCVKSAERKDFIEIMDEGFVVYKNGEISQSYKKIEDGNYENHLAIALLELKNPVLFDDEHFKVSNEKFEENRKKAADERDIKISNKIKSVLRESELVTSKEIREVERELKEKISAWIEDPEHNKINSMQDLIDSVDTEYQNAAKSFVETFNSSCDLLMSSKQTDAIEHVEVLKVAASLEDFAPSFDSREQGEIR